MNNITNPSATWPQDEYPEQGPYLRVGALMEMFNSGEITAEDGLFLAVIIDENGFLKEVPTHETTLSETIVMAYYPK